MKKKIITTLVMLISASPCFATIYKYTDPNGNIVYSDEKKDGAEEVELPPIQTYSPFDNEPTQAELETEDAPTEVSDSYTISILDPQNGFVVQDGIQTVNVQVSVQPSLTDNTSLQLFFDNDPLGGPTKSTSFSISQLIRGQHIIKVQVIDTKTNVVLKESTPVTIFVNRATIIPPA